MSSNKSDGLKLQGNNANTSNNSNNSKQQSSKLQRQTSATSVLPTFFRWFKKPNHRNKQQFHSGRSAIEPSLRRYDSCSRESLSFHSSQNYLDNHLSPSLSCDSVVSTSTTGFAFIKPNKYGNLVEPKILSDNQIDTNSIKRLNNNRTENNIRNSLSSTKQNSSDNNNDALQLNEETPKLTLKEKYFLFESDTLKSTASITSDATLRSSSSSAANVITHGNYDNILLSNRNQYDTPKLDQPEHIYINNNNSNKENEVEPTAPCRRHRSRRTVSDSLKELQSGAYVHVKGKRKAPDPPPSSSSNTNSIITISSTITQSSNPFEDSYTEPSRRDNYRTLSPVSTFGRKKRKAPPPPSPLLTDLQSSNKSINLVKKNSKSPSVTRRTTTPSSQNSSIAEEIQIESAKKINIKYAKSTTTTTPTPVVTENFIQNKLLQHPSSNNDITTLFNKSESNLYSNICEAGIHHQSSNHLDNTSSSSSSVSVSNQYQNVSLNNNSENSLVKMPGSPLKRNTQPSEIRDPKKITLNQDQMNNSEHLKITNNSGDLTSNDSSTFPTPPNSPISPRPWYKRPMSTNKESIIPFKREVVLKTMEKRKSKPTKISPDSGLPEVSFSRSSIFDTTNKFNLFSRQKDTKSAASGGKDKEKRLSNINMPNISELDREAAQILMNESKQTSWNENKSYNPPEHLKLHQDMFGSTELSKKEENNLASCKNENVDSEGNQIDEVSQSTKDLINKFETQTEGPKVTINLSYIGKTESFIGSPTKISTTKNAIESPAVKDENDETVNKKDLLKLEHDLKKTTKTNVTNKEDKVTAQQSQLIDNLCENKSGKIDNKSIKLTWSCSYCTLENPNWRIICEVCEHLKPFQGIQSDEINNENSRETRKPDVGKLIKSLSMSPPLTQSSSSSSQDWEWKAEIVKKYFQKQDATTTVVSNGVTVPCCSNNSPKLQSILRKSPSPSRLPISSPRLSRNDRIQSDHIVKQNEIDSENHKKLQDNKIVTKTNNYKDSNHQVGKNDINFINLEQIRVARLAKFSIPPPVVSKESVKQNLSSSSNSSKENSNFLNDPNSLEMEKQRLREKIRAMNAKALAEKYPIVKKSLSLDDPTLDPPVVVVSQRQTSGKTRNNNQRPASTIFTTTTTESTSSAEDKQDNELENFNLNQKGEKSLNSNDNILDVQDEDSINKNILINSSNFKPFSHLTNFPDPLLSSPDPKSGAIKKIFSKTKNINAIFAEKNLDMKLSNTNLQNKSIDDEIYLAQQNNKPNKVSSSCQTSSAVVQKKSDNNYYETKPNVSVNALLSPIHHHGHKYGDCDLAVKNDHPKLQKLKNDNSSIIQYQKLSDFDKAQVKEISKKLTSAEGRNHFKMNLNENQGKGLSRTDTLVLNKILRNLEQAICEGKHELAAKLAMDLAKMRVSLQVTKLKSKKSSSFDQDQNFIVDMFIEDRVSQKGPIQISIKPSMTVRELKEKALKDYHIPIQLQKWKINEELLTNENLTLYECGVINNIVNLYLYLLSPLLGSNGGGGGGGSNDGIINNDNKFTIPLKKSKSFQDDQNSDQNSIDSLEMIVDSNNQQQKQQQQQQKGSISLPPPLSSSHNNTTTTTIIQKTSVPDRKLKSSDVILKTEDEIPWECPLCTLINNPMALSCSACSKTKPLNKNEKSSISDELKRFLREENVNSIIDAKLKKKFTNFGSTNAATAINLDSSSASSLNTNTTTTTTIMITSTSNNNSNNNFNLNNTKKDNTKNKVLLRPIEQRNDLNKTNPNRKSTEIYNIIEEIIKPIPANLSETKLNPIIIQAENQQQQQQQQPKQQQRIVTINNFSSPNPNITKNKYRGVDNFNPYRKDTNNEIIFSQHQQHSQSSQQNQSQQISPTKSSSFSTSSNSTNSTVQQLGAITKDCKSIGIKTKIDQSISPPLLTTKLKSPYSTSHYLDLLKLDYSNVVRNFEPFECPICFGNIERGNGIVLRECLHSFCKECLADTVKFNEEAQVKCPYMDRQYSCNSLLQEREIRSLVTKDIYEKHLAKSIKLAEHRIENAFHCKTANCRGWCIYEDNVNEFLCPVCNLKNCLTCAAIHDGITCKQYQDGLNNCDNNEDAKRTKEMFQDMVEKGEALNCPTCQVIMMKKWGCDWLKCSMCKTEVCWVTKGPRWGPAGKGDTSGGCKCGVNGVKCHLKCNYCH